MTISTYPGITAYKSIASKQGITENPGLSSGIINPEESAYLQEDGFFLLKEDGSFLLLE